MLTESQRRALSHTRHLSVTANAGSGKTRVLVERYIDVLLTTDAAVNEVVTLTYTDKAASELKRRVADTIAERIAAGHDPAVTLRLESIRSELASALIGTIHWFCGRLLREYPVEAGVDASFAVVEGMDQRILVQESVAETFQTLLAAPSGQTVREEVLEALRRLGRARVVDLVNTLVEKRDQLARLAGDTGPYADSDESILLAWRKALGDAIDAELQSPVFTSDAEKLLGIARGKNADDARALLERFRACASVAERVSVYAELMGKMFRKDGGLFVAFLGKDGEPERVAAEAGRMGRRCGAILPLARYIEGSEGEDQHRSLLRVTRCLLAVASAAAERYEEKKTESGRLDFNDLQLKAKRLLGREEVRAALSRRFTFIMVDEFQDTNALQVEILRPILTGLASGNLFIVGDPKQSIYGFRDANVGVFNLTKEEISRSAGAESEIVLGESFRPLRDLVAFVNLVFSRVMNPPPEITSAGGALAVNEVEYQPLIRARQNVAAGSVELLVRDRRREEEQPGEGEMIARRILGLSRQRHEVFDGSEKPRPVNFRDIALLLRSRAPLPGLEEAFIRHGIPYVVTGGVGYFQTQDTYDFYSYLQFLLNPADDGALVGILRSPFFCVSDAELFEVAWERRPGSLWDHLRSPHSRAAAIASLQSARAVLADDLRVALRYPVPDLIDRIVRETSYDAKVLTTARGEQAMANLEKLRRLARSYEIQGFTNAYDFVGRLKRLVDEEEKEGQGTVDAQGDAVQIMTVHAAKGLEFPVVIVPSLERDFRYDREPFIDDRLGISFALRTGDEGGEPEPAPLTHFMREMSRRRTEAEEKRIFYVACTRARDTLILSGEIGGKRDSPDWMNWLLDGLRVQGEIGEGRLDFQVSTQVLLPDDRGFRTAEEEHLLSINVLRPQDLPPIPPHTLATVNDTAVPRMATVPLVPVPGRQIFSATSVRTYLACPAKYHLRYVLGLPTGTGPFARGESDIERDTEFPAELRGRLFHAVMEQVDRYAADPSGIAEGIRKAIQREVPSGMENSSPMAQDIDGLVRRFLGSTFWKKIRDASDVRTEFSVTAALGDDFISGTMDRLFRTDAGVWTIVDYKTEAVTSGKLDAAGESYLPQMMFYALLLDKLLSAAPLKFIILFTALMDNPFERVITREDLSRFESELRQAIGEMKRGVPHAPGKPCNDCPFLPAGCAGMSPADPSRERNGTRREGVDLPA